MPAKRTAASPAAPASPPVWNAAILGAAVAAGLGILVRGNRLSWPPRELLSGAYTLAGCLALVGPVLLARRSGESRGVGDLAWMTGGLLLWAFDLAAAVQGGAGVRSWVTPLAPRTLGLTTLAVVLAAWQTRSGGATWTWTNVTGWILALFWVGMGLVALGSGSGLVAWAN